MLRRRSTKTAKPGAAHGGSPVGDAEVNYVEMSFARVPIFQACTREELMHVARVTRIRDHQPGDVIVHEGAPGRDFYVVLDGEVTVTRGGREVAVLRAGDFFGELALFDPAPRNATVTARTALRLVVLGQPEFHAVLAEEAIRDNVFAGMARRLHELDQRY